MKRTLPVSYDSPRMDVMEIDTSAVLCESTEIKDLTKEDFDVDTLVSETDITEEGSSASKNEKTSNRKKSATLWMWASLGFTAFSYLINVII